MFNVGSKVFYPFHGAGKIEAIEEKEISGETRMYYIMTFPNKNMKVMIPQGNEGKTGIRSLVEQEILDHVLNGFNDEETDQTIKPNQRHRFYMNKMKSGSIYDEAEVIRDLNRLSKNGNLGEQDKKMFREAQEYFISELSLVKEITEEDAEALLNSVMN